MYGPVKPKIQIKTIHKWEMHGFLFKRSIHHQSCEPLNPAQWKKQGDVLRTSGITLPLGFQGSPTLISNTYTTWKCPEVSHSEENVCCVWIILSFSFRCGGQCSWWGCGRITGTTPSTVPISLLMASVDLVLSSSYTSPSAGPAGYFSQIKKTKILYHIMILMFARTTPQH